MTQHFATRQLRFFLTAPTPCPYLPGRQERKVFAHLPVVDGPLVNDTLTSVGFRRSQNIAYRPACEGCDACVSARVPTTDYAFSRSERRILQRNDHLQRHLVEAEATREQFELLTRYLDDRHPGGGMTGMGWSDYVAMVEDTTARTHIVEWRQPSHDHGPGELAGCAIVDVLGDGLSLVYSFFDPALSKNSPGVFAILDHIVQAQLTGIPYVYLGYWVGGSPKMDYKARFRPLEVLRFTGWTRLPDKSAP